MNDMEKKQHEALAAALAAEHKIGALNDDELEGVSGGFGGIGGPQGAVVTGPFSIAQCKICGWSAVFDGKGEYDTQDLAIDHMRRHPGCPGNFAIYDF